KLAADQRRAEEAAAAAAAEEAAARAAARAQANAEATTTEGEVPATDVAQSVEAAAEPVAAESGE
ncbi:MAG: hypothetical protein QOJ59_4121, partial [Thermomicrobiales bacterium]|nr:hypothetical protein [Thermomicrobiales bacterium]